MSVKYTPGPWVAAGFWVEHPDENVPDICTCDPRDIDQSSLLRSHSEIEANARLIAAAPDMIAALRVALYHTQMAADRANALAAWNKRDGKDGIAAEYARLAAESEQAVKYIRPAITKATGEQA